MPKLRQPKQGILQALSRRPAVIIGVALIIGGLVTGGLFLIGDGDSGQAGPTSGSGQAGPTPGPTTSPGSGTDAEFSFDGLEVLCGFENVITAQERLAAEGQFCLADFTVTNEGEEARALDLSCQFLHDTGGDRHEPHRQATLLDPSGVQLFQDGLEPGEQVEEGSVMFDVPQDAAISEIELHGDCDSPGLRLPA